MEEQANKLYNQIEWRKKIREELPKLAIRIFALRNKSYNGCGFHYSLEKLIGYLLWKANNFDKSIEATDSAILEVIYEDLCERVSEIETSLKGQI